MNTTTSHLKEIVMQGVFTACACISILAVALICIFLFANGLPTIFEIGPLKFLLGTTWKPGNNLYGILPMILGSIYVTAGAIIVGVPIGLLTAIYMSRFASPRINKVLLPAVQLLAGIPSVVYGFFGMIVLVGGQLIVEHVYSYSVPVSVFITVGGGLYFLYLLLTRKKV